MQFTLPREEHEKNNGRIECEQSYRFFWLLIFHLRQVNESQQNAKKGGETLPQPCTRYKFISQIEFHARVQNELQILRFGAKIEAKSNRWHWSHSMVRFMFRSQV